MTQEEHYNSKEEKLTIVKFYEDKNREEGTAWRPISNSFDDPDWKHGDPQVGTLIFTDEPESQSATRPTRNPLVEIDELKADIKAIKTKLEIK